MSESSVKPNPSAVQPIVPRVFRRDSVELCNSEDVRRHFGKKHYHVLRDIRVIMARYPDQASWFIQTTTLDNYGREQPSFDMTKDGFTILVMSWTGQKAMDFKVEYIAYITEFYRLAESTIH